MDCVKNLQSWSRPTWTIQPHWKEEWGGGGNGRSENCQEDSQNVCICWKNIVDDEIYIGGMIMDLSSIAIVRVYLFQWVLTPNEGLFEKHKLGHK